MGKRILITGGAGFIGSHLTDELIAHGYSVRILDNLSEQVHGPDAVRPDYLNSDAELVVGDVRDPEAVDRALNGIDAVFHFAAVVGVGQSMYDIARYTAVNNYGTSVLLQTLTNHQVEQLVVASSMSVYGEGQYKDAEGRPATGIDRSLEQLRKHQWEVQGSNGDVLVPQPTTEAKTPSLASIYALSKYDQERMCLIVGRTYGMPTVALRFFNVYGTRQALSNPYTGVLAIFASRLINNNRPFVFEDGLQQRDFVSVKDVALACRLVLETPDLSDQVINVGSGVPRTILEIASRMSSVMGRPELEAQITGEYRMGDIRHCFADISLARSQLQFEPQVSLCDGISELSAWLETQVAVDRVAEHRAELLARGLTI